MSEVRTAQVIYGYMAAKLSRKKAERFVMLDAAERGVDIPQPPVARFWCRPSPPGSPLPWMIGWTGPMVVAPQATHDQSARGSLVN